MRNRSFAIAAAACVLLVLLPGPATAHHRPGPCALHRGTDEPIRHFSKRLIVCATEQWQVKGGAERAVCIADRESGLIPTAVGHGANDDYLGLFQHAATYWPARYETSTLPGWELADWALNARSNAIVTIRMVAVAGGWKAAGWPIFDC